MGRQYLKGPDSLLEGVLFVDMEKNQLVEVVFGHETGRQFTTMRVKRYASDEPAYWIECEKLSTNPVTNPMEILAWVAK